jgi:hypothetical protein
VCPLICIIARHRRHCWNWYPWSYISDFESFSRTHRLSWGFALDTICQRYVWPIHNITLLSTWYYPTIAEPPAGQLRFANAATTNFTSSLLTSAAGLFRSSYFGTGGDEINANCYNKDPQTQSDLS